MEAFLTLLLSRGEQVGPGREISACRDPKDDKFLEVAVAGRADVLVSGDADLQSLHPFERVRILSRHCSWSACPVPCLPRPPIP